MMALPPLQRSIHLASAGASQQLRLAPLRTAPEQAVETTWAHSFGNRKKPSSTEGGMTLSCRPAREVLRQFFAPAKTAIRLSPSIGARLGVTDHRDRAESQWFLDPRSAEPLGRRQKPIAARIPWANG